MRKWLIFIIIILIIIGSVFALIHKVRSAGTLPIQQVTVTGQLDHINQLALINSVKPIIYQKGFFGIDLNAVRQTVEQQAWVASADVQRVWPNKLFITVVEQTPLATWNQAGLVNPYGEVFYPVQRHFSQDLPEFFSDNQSSSLLVLARYQEMSEILDATGLKITILKLANDESWELTLSNGMKVQLGKTEILTRLQRFVKVYAKVFDSPKKHAKTVDLRYSNGMAVQW